MKKNKDLTKVSPKEKIINLPISRFIDTKYREYATYVLEQRGIPDFHDALTPVQRYILKNTPTSFVKCLTIVGKVVQDGYHHGPASIESAINRLARPFGNSAQLLDGYGFFGSEVSPDAAASRYTSAKLASFTNNILNEYNYLTTKEPEGPYDPLWLDIPLGLVIPIIGIAIGYKTAVLPRKIEDIQKFLDGKIKSLKPHFKDFNGAVEKFKNIDRSWLISSKITVDNNRIQIREIPPVVKYSSLIKRLDTLYSKFEGKIKILNNSNTKVNIDVIYTGKSKEEFNEVNDFVYKTFSIIVTENPVFIKEGQVLVYNSVEEYLTDFKWQISRLQFKNNEYEVNKLNFDIKFNIAKELFINFIITKKRSNQEITTWLNDYEKDISERLERMTSRKFSTDEIKETKETIIQLKNELKLKQIELKNTKKIFEELKDPTEKRGIKSRKNIINLLDDVEDISEDKTGIKIFNIEEILDEKSEDDENSLNI
jgi:DNA gyrase/topoisomerase IV subunit A